MTVSQPDGDGQSSSLALLIWMMITIMPQPLPPRRPGPCVATIVTATSSGWRGERRMKPCVQLRSTRMELHKRRPRDGRGGEDGNSWSVEDIIYSKKSGIHGCSVHERCYLSSFSPQQYVRVKYCCIFQA